MTQMALPRPEHFLALDIPLRLDAGIRQSVD